MTSHNKELALTMMPLFSRTLAQIFCSVWSPRAAFFLADRLPLVMRSASLANYNAAVIDDNRLHNASWSTFRQMYFYDAQNYKSTGLKTSG